MNPEEVHSLAIMACLNGEPLPKEAKALYDNADFRAEVKPLAALESALFDAGEGLNRQIPSVNLVAGIQAHLQLDVTDNNPLPSDEILINAHLDAALDELSKARLERRLAEDPALRAEWESLQQTSNALKELAESIVDQEDDIDIVEAVLDAVRKHHNASVLLELAPQTETLEDALFELGGEINLQVPAIDLSDTILALVQQVKVNEAENITAFGVKQGKPGSAVQGAAAPQAPKRWVWAGYAAAAMAIFAMGIATQSYLNSTSQGIYQTARSDGNAFIDYMKERKANHQLNIARAPELTIRPGQLGTEGEQVVNADGEIEHKIPSLEDILEARRKALVDDTNALASLAEWASLSPEEALAILEKSGYSPESILGVMPYLDAEQSLAILKDAVAKFPRDSQLRFALAKELLDSEDFLSARQQLEQWSKLDPENGLPVYMDAQVLLAQGDIEGARAALYDASQYDKLDTFSVAAAKYHRDALIASGIDPNTAKLLAGMSAFNGDYSQLQTLGQSFLDEGSKLQSAGDYLGAADMYKSAAELGENIVDGTSFPNEALEGVSLQEESAMLMSAVIPYLSPDEAAFYGNESMQALYDSIAILDELYRAVNALYSGDIDGILGFLGAAF